MQTRTRLVRLGSANGDESFIIVSSAGIASAKITEAALRESEARYWAIVEMSPLIAWSADPRGAILDVAERWYRLTGLTPEQTLGVGWLSAVHPEDLPEFGRRWAFSVQTGEPLSIEARYRLQDGTYWWVHARATALRDDAGRIIRWFGTLEDIQDRKVAEQALRESETFAHSVLGNSPDCIRVLDLDGRLQFMNEAGHRLLETGGDATLGQDWAATLPAEYADEIRGAFASARAGHPSRHHAHRVTRSGAAQWLDITITPIPDGDDRPARILSIWHDVTEVRQAHETAEQVRREAEAAATRLSWVLESTTDCVVVLDRDWRLTYLNGKAKQMLRSQNPRIGLSLWEIYPEEAEGVFARNYRRAMEQ